MGLPNSRALSNSPCPSGDVDVGSDPVLTLTVMVVSPVMT